VAIVAIIGGFITATLLMLTAEKRSLVNRLNEKKQRYERINNPDPTIPNVSALKQEIEILDKQIKEFSYPPNLGWGLLVLGFLAVFGILFPVLIIASETFNCWIKYLTLTCFWLGIIGVFAYIVSQIRTLRR
jgi:hypothetical protein